MNVVRFHIELADPGQADAVAAAVRERLGQLDGVDRVQAAPTETRDLATVIAVVAAAVAFTRSGGDLVASLRHLVQELQGLVTDLRGLKRVVLNVDGEEVDIDQMDDEQLAALAAAEDAA
ncbi:hypothetical protein [Phytohabitans rumicis]|uniref:Uncharacterized protein n=1 Tax=Phytohabitans rumicis TaxID=1076125 RepID=A0A6V8LM86_9ACTN|nr:hypothetical protein [Phytohabitans rumicis]GFJ95286.1 hypothetical protein Prum_089280 [Phytohabitans rumicis]